MLYAITEAYILSDAILIMYLVSDDMCSVHTLNILLEKPQKL